MVIDQRPGAIDSEVMSQLGTKLHRAFMAEVGEEVCQAEVAHHANKSPEYLCSRPEKHVHVPSSKEPR